MGRALRIVLGLALMVYVVPVYFQIPARMSVRVLLLMLGLVGACSLIHIVISQRIFAFDPRLGAVAASAFLVALYVGGATGLPIIGHGAGELSAVTLLSVSLLVAGLCASPGCELMAIPGLFFGKPSELPCIIFSPLDKLERKWRSKRDV
jgi:hypothetical protein